jgi:lysophospholipase L1-like esterase
VTITGKEFGEDTRVRFGAVDATSVVVTSAATLEAVTPPGTPRSTVDVAITTNGHTVVAPRAFTYAGDLEPLVFSATPASGPTGGGTTIDILGEQLSPVLGVTIGGVAASVTTLSGSHLRVTAPPHAAGSANLTVTTAGGSATLADAFAYWSTSAPRRILAFGDSVTAGLTAGTPGDGGYPSRLQERLARKYPSRGILVDNAGVSGECISTPGCNGVATGGEARFPNVLQAAHDTVVLLHGVNDLSAGLDAADALASVRRVVVESQLSGRRVVVVSLVPGTAEPAGLPAIQAFNASLAALAEERGIPFVDVYTPLAADLDLMSSDDLHPTDEGYDLIAELIFDAIVANFGSLP